MAWGLEARVPFLDKTFLDVAMDIDSKEKSFSKGTSQEFDEDGRPKMEKVSGPLTLSTTRPRPRTHIIQVHFAQSL